MKRVIIALLALMLFALPACTKTRNTESTIEGNVRTYVALSDGTYRCDGYTYPYRVEVTGRMHSAVKDSTFVYLSQWEEIPFERAWRAAGFGDSTDDYFDKEDAVLVEMF